MTEQEMRALFLLAGIPVTKVYPLANGYCSRACCLERPWWLVETPRGLVQIGWRKRVINIDWSATDLRRQATRDDVTKGEDMVHAWGYAKAVEYLTTLSRDLNALAKPPLCLNCDETFEQHIYGETSDGTERRRCNVTTAGRNDALYWEPATRG